jgi:hypothetical protein
VIRNEIVLKLEMVNENSKSSKASLPDETIIDLIELIIGAIIRNRKQFSPATGGKKENKQIIIYAFIIIKAIEPLLAAGVEEPEWV